MLKFILFFIVIFNSVIFSQARVKYDKIIKFDNEILEVKINKISSDEIEFVYPNETINNILKTSLVKTIVFSSGRIQNFENNSTESKNVNIANNIVEANQPLDKSNFSRTIEPNTIAVLPINFYDKNNGVFLEQNATLAQQQTVDFLMKQSNNILPLKIVDTRKINSLLKKSGVSVNDLDNFTIEDLHNIIGSDHIVIIKVAYTLKRSNTSYNTSNKDLNFGSSNEDLIYDYEIAMDIYRNNDILYKKTRTPFWNFKDSWLDAVKFLIERAPFYKD